MAHLGNSLSRTNLTRFLDATPNAFRRSCLRACAGADTHQSKQPRPPNRSCPRMDAYADMLQQRSPSISRLQPHEAAVVYAYVSSLTLEKDAKRFHSLRGSERPWPRALACIDEHASGVCPPAFSPPYTGARHLSSRDKEQEKQARAPFLRPLQGDGPRDTAIELDLRVAARELSPLRAT
jgi:hypothetical protein